MEDWENDNIVTFLFVEKKIPGKKESYCNYNINHRKKKKMKKGINRSIIKL